MGWEKYADEKHWHESANLFPLVNDADLQNLARDIGEHGLQNPIVLFQGKVLDGRNRARACKLAGIEPRFTTWHQNGIGPSQYVVSQNLSRRHLTYDQRAGLALKLRKLLAAEAKKRKGGRPKNGHKPSALVRPVSGKSAALAARDFGIGTRNLEQLIAVQKVQSHLAAQLIAGEATVRAVLKKWHVTKQTAKPRKSTVEQFGGLPHTVFDAKRPDWNDSKAAWRELGIKGEEGRGAHSSHPANVLGRKPRNRTSVFDPVLCELIYRWFAPEHGEILDPFAGESTKGIVAAYRGHHYTGVEVRRKQVSANNRQALAVRNHAPNMKVPVWICGDSAKLEEHLPAGKKYDLVFTSPPYFNLEVYSAHKNDGSAFGNYHDEFLPWYAGIFRQAVARLKDNRFLVVKIGDVRDAKGFYYNLVGDTISCLLNLDLKLYNMAVLATPYGTVPLRAKKQFTHYRKLFSVSQHVLVFFKGDSPKMIPEELGILNGYENI